MERADLGMDNLNVFDPVGGPRVIGFPVEKGGQLAEPGLPQLLGRAPVLEDGQIDVPIRQVRLQRHRSVRERLHLLDGRRSESQKVVSE
jgi:hypothetical protein